MENNGFPPPVRWTGSPPAPLHSKLLLALAITQTDWDDCWSEMRAYRNAFVAHLDNEHTMQIPTMSLPRRMVTFYYNHVLGSDGNTDYFQEFPTDLNDYYDRCNSVAASKTKT